MKCVVYILLLLPSEIVSVHWTGKTTKNVWPGSTSSVQWHNIHADNAPHPVRVWSTESTSYAPDSLQTDKSPWVQCEGVACHCSGSLRISDDADRYFSYPVAVSDETASVQCSVSGFQSFLWPGGDNERSADSSCQCRRLLPMYITLRRKCLSVGDLAAWPGPGLVNCTESPELVTEWKYHLSSGQIRSPGGLCLSAVPYHYSNVSDWKPWSVQTLPCLNYIDPKVRQAWAVPEGVGRVGEASLFNSVFHAANKSWRPSGHTGRIRLRDSSDIGNRCLEIAVNPPVISTKVPVVWMEAIVCDDIRFTDRDLANFQFVHNTQNATEPTGMWSKCDSAHCDECFDDELRATMQNGQTSQTVSIPNGFAISENTCNINSIRAMAIPETLRGSSLTDTSKCYCQTQLPRYRPHTLLWANTDDIPTTIRPQFPASHNNTRNHTIT